MGERGTRRGAPPEGDAPRTESAEPSYAAWAALSSSWTVLASTILERNSNWPFCFFEATMIFAICLASWPAPRFVRWFFETFFAMGVGVWES